MKLELKYFVVILSVICIFLLYFMSTLQQPTDASLSELSKYDGMQVIVQGIVTNHYTTTYGGHIIFIKEFNNNTAYEGKLFVEQETTVEYGDKIKATGKVQQNYDAYEVVVNDARMVEIIQKWSNISFPLWQLVRNPNNYIGMNVNITGTIGTVYDSYFYLTDSFDQYSLVVNFIAEKSHHIYQGNTVYVHGIFHYDEKSLQFVLNVVTERHSISPTQRE
jgi:hypothetical protein